MEHQDIDLIFLLFSRYGLKVKALFKVPDVREYKSLTAHEHSASLMLIYLRKYLLSMYYALGSVVVTRDIIVIRGRSNSCPSWSLYPTKVTQARKMQ